MRRWRENPANLAKENAARKARRRADPEAVAAADHRYEHSFRGVVRHMRHEDKQALARLDQQVREGMSSL